MASPYAQLEHRVRLEWGPIGAAETAPDSTYAVVVDVLSFTTTLSVAMDLGAEVLPSPNGSAISFALARGGAQVLGACLRNRSAAATCSSVPAERPDVYMGS